MQRLRLSFGGGEEVKFISHLDVLRFWERAFRRTRIPLRLFKNVVRGFVGFPQKSQIFVGDFSCGGKR